ncbi:hypothetical protein GOP47_0012103 [Adiantum capillus-veneris]|uniref:Heterokaryon incompatibility domain-containing protein n=1 Tax=Adiantum capillus-veneris TaxID=13818 RepID=A0A9D4UR35_ADICA|nr:hypothetical protein GOP47_0012103 [Adiantum capillus-veneris]
MPNLLELDQWRTTMELYPWQEEQMEQRDRSREKFLERAGLDPPAFLRVIDCQHSVSEGAVVLIDWDLSPDTACIHGAGGYTAISHTYGMEVYEVFDCVCAAKCFCIKQRANPSKTHCEGHSWDPNPLLQKSKILDILTMCHHLLQGGCLYAWHDGVCIAQFDKEEVSHFIQHIGWIYAHAQDTVIFLHYIGQPMAPIAAGPRAIDLVSRWQTRVWTFQEAALSKRRRFCVRNGLHLLGCRSWAEFELKLALMYEPPYSNAITIMDEKEFYNYILELLLAMRDVKRADGEEWPNSTVWFGCICSWLSLISTSFFSFPNIVLALEQCSRRESKHEGDRINSILALAGIQGYDAPKDEKLEESTIQFFRSLKAHIKGLALALFTTNSHAPPAYAASCVFSHTWLPCLSGPLMICISHLEEEGLLGICTNDIEFEVLEDGNLELTGLLSCVHVQCHVVQKEEDVNSLSEDIRQCSCEDGLNVVICTGNYNYVYYKAFLAGGNLDVSLGELLLPKLCRADDGEMEDCVWRTYFKGLSTERWQDLQAFSASKDEESRTFYLNRLKLPSVQHFCGNPNINLLSFCASLILPAKVLELDFNDFLLVPSIVVQGDLSKPVVKLGCFHGNKAFHDILRQQLAPCTTLTHLLIR